MLHELIASHHQEITRRCRTKVAARSIPSGERAHVDDELPAFLEQLQGALRARLIPSADIQRTALRQGRQLLRQGLTVSDVVRHYGDVCQAITELAVETHQTIGADDFRMLNLCLDDAIAGAVTEFGRQQNQSTLDGEKARGNQRAGFVAHEMRNLLNTAIMALEVLKTGDVAVGGSTGAVLERSLMGARNLTMRSLAEVRLTQGVRNVEQFAASGFIEQLAPAAVLEGNARGIALRVLPGEDGVFIEADRQVLTAVVMNLLQNAFKFTKPGTTVVLRVRASVERVLLEIEDECGGLPIGSVDDLFRPFEQSGADRSGLGLGLAFSRWAVEANNGRIHAASLPEKGCVFTIDLPRIPVPAIAMVAGLDATPPIILS
jgi:signal transduction histidine kinase